MYNFHSIKELLNTLTSGKELLGEMFGKRKSFDYRYNQAIELDNYDENRVNALIDKGIIQRNGRYLEIEEQLLSFFEQILDVNEEINISLIHEQITSLRENIDYYLSEDTEYQKGRYLKIVKTTLRKIGLICSRNIDDLYRNIDSTFKTEPNYKIKIKKLENYGKRRDDIKQLIQQTETFVTEDELTFFATAKDQELIEIKGKLLTDLNVSMHILIEIEKQIIDFINQVREQNKKIEKIRQIKYLKDQYELENKSDILGVLNKENAILFEKRTNTSVKLSLDILQEDSIYQIIKTLSQKDQSKTKKKISLAGAIDPSFFNETEESDLFIDLEKMKTSFTASGYHLLEFVLQYNYPKQVHFEDIVTYYCQLISLYENDFKFTDRYITHKGVEFSVVYPI
ncbi:hypothetical protein K4L44_03940 [Halosquirtibacter laminarini]|uniref:Uncharacterized protein n=1 Tax=Halosquirtibacter laminarini TaxID=3374600 RepID=A0AC61NH59_9BACT|nr:hypothetical protein K4L44_03940 [Prolixibacteraceae bacterium]